MRVLDLFCGAGGAAMGYHRTGFDVVGVDICDQPRFPFDFVRDDALTTQTIWQDFDLIHASPPCQAYTTMSVRWRGQDTLADTRPSLIAAIRERLRVRGLPYVIENVPGAARELWAPIRLTGEMFGLRVHRPRLFECHPMVMSPPPEPRQADPVAVYGKLDGRRLWTRTDGTELRAPTDVAEAGEAMGIDWMEWDELRESIPPAYTEWIGAAMMRMLSEAKGDGWASDL